jgi:two-component system cell cycle sensor histidine kinase/response regulator CckA
VSEAPLRLLIVEDSPTDAKLVVTRLKPLRREVVWERVETAEAMRAALRDRAWDFVISDWSMPQFSALAAAAILAELDMDLPFIIVSGTIGEETAVEAMRAGARDFVLKDNLGRLHPAVERELREAAERAARRKAEAELRESERRFRAIADSGIMGFATGDFGGQVYEANDAFLALVGYTREELAAGAVHWADLTPQELHHFGERALEELRTTGVARPWETEAVRKDRSRVPILIGAVMLEPPRGVAFAIDLSQQRAAEAGRLRAEKALERSEAQLRQAQKMEAVGRLAGGVAHDFNNVLSVILSYAEILSLDLREGDPMRADLEEIAKAGRRAAELTRQLLVFSRQNVIEPRVLDINDILASMYKMLQRILGEDIELVVVAEQSSAQVKVDPTSIEQVIMNLVVNARDAMPTGGKLTLETAEVFLDAEYVSLHPGAATGPHVMLAVSDNGVGMDRATQERIFDPFFTTKEKGKGTGLGLSTVFGIVQQSGGTIWVYSEPGKGSTFKVYLPRVDGPLEHGTSEAPARALEGDETILLVEDEEPIRVVTRELLKRSGYRVLEARNGGEAILLCERHLDPIDLLLTDVVMPQMSGPELAKRIRSMRPDIKVLCMSGYTDDSVIRHGLLQAEMAFIQKPITPKTLTRKVREVLDGPTSRRLP